MMDFEYKANIYAPRWRRRRFAGVERLARVLQSPLNFRRERVCTAKHAPRDPCRVLDRRHGLADIVERGAIVLVERPRVKRPHHERDFMVLSEDALRRGQYFAQRRLGFLEAFLIVKGRRVVDG